MKNNLFFYRLKEKILISKEPYDNLKEFSKDFIKSFRGRIYALNKLPKEDSRRSYCVTSPHNLFIEREDLNLLINKTTEDDFSEWILENIKKRNITAVNTQYENWQEVLDKEFPISLKSNKKWNLTIVGLGDVGGTLITGLRLMGGDSINHINIYDKDENKMKRWEYECNQILWADINKSYPSISTAEESNLFDCDMFVFCVSVGVPEVGKEISDVRLAQFEGNKKIVSYYAKLAAQNNFKGIFSVVSDPVDLLCNVALKESNGALVPEQIRGYGLGVMNARSCYYASKDDSIIHYLKEGRAFGPHGEDLVIADSMTNYNHELSLILTDKTKKANLEIRSTGFKPYIAPALSSGSLSLISTIKGEWHYSATFIGGAFMGCRNRLLPTGIELETYDNIDEILFERLQHTYNKLKAY